MAKSKIAAHVTLYFIRGPRPSAEDEANAAEMKGEVRFRNVMKATCDGALEAFNAVAGLVPDCYAEAARIKAGLPASEAPTPASTLPGPSSPLKPSKPPKAPEPAKAPSPWKPNA